MVKIYFLIMLICFAENVWASGTDSTRPRFEFYIGKNGSSANPGTHDHPFSSLEDARSALRQLKKNNRLPVQGITVWLLGGIYELKKSFELGNDDSGTDNAPVIYRAFPGETVILTGGIKIPVSKSKMLSGLMAKRTVDRSAIPNIREIDLAALGISDYGINSVSGFRRPYVNAAMELFINGKPYHLARYPNKEKIPIRPEDVIDKGIRSNNDFYPGSIRFNRQKLAQWTEAKNIFASGNFKYAWATDQLRVKAIYPESGTVEFADAHMWGISGGKEWNSYYFYNLPEEIDEAGEYYIDHQKGKLYFYPLETLKPTDTIFVSALEDALVTIKNTGYIQFSDICFEAGRGIGIYMENTEHVRISNCIIRNMGVLGVCIGKGTVAANNYKHPDPKDPVLPDEKLSGRLGSLYDLLYEQTTFNRDGGKDNGIINCSIEHTGCGGVSLGGGNRVTLEPAGNYVYNCEFTDCGRIDYSYKSPVNIDGVGNKIRHCQFNTCAATAIYLHGNNHLIEYNEIREACNFIDDQGAIYMGRDPSEFGNTIRYNFFRNIGHFGMTMAVYYDDGACGSSLYGNVFYKAGSRTVMIGGGSYNPVYNNIFIESEMAIHLDNRLDGWSKNMLGPGSLFEKRLKAVNYKQSPYSEAYPALSSYFEDNPQTPKHNDIQNNVFVNVQQLHNGQKEWGPFLDNNLITSEDPGFEDAAALNFNLKTDAEVFKKLPTFKSIPFKEMGRIKTK